MSVHRKAYDEIVDFFARGTSSTAVLGYHPSAEAQERARYLLVSELAMAKNCEELQIEELLSKALSKSKLHFPEASEFQA